MLFGGPKWIDYNPYFSFIAMKLTKWLDFAFLWNPVQFIYYFGVTKWFKNRKVEKRRATFNLFKAKQYDGDNRSIGPNTIQHVQTIHF